MARGVSERLTVTVISCDGELSDRCRIQSTGRPTCVPVTGGYRLRPVRITVGQLEGGDPLDRLLAEML